MKRRASWCSEAVARTAANVSLIFVPAPFAADAVLEAAYAEVPVIICITEGVPTMDMVRVRRFLRGSGIIVIGPNCPGVITPGEARAGIMPGHVFSPGRVGVISRSGSLATLMCQNVTSAGFGINAFIGIGGDPIIGTTTREALEALDNDEGTEAVVIVGEIGGAMEEEAAEYAAAMSKPVIAFIAGGAAPAGRKMGHAGAIVVGNRGTCESKQKALQAAGVTVLATPSDVGGALKERLGP